MGLQTVQEFLGEPQNYMEGNLGKTGHPADSGRGSEHCVCMEGRPVHEDQRSRKHVVTTEEKTESLGGGAAHAPQSPSSPDWSKNTALRPQPPQSSLEPEFPLWAELSLVTISFLSI